MTKEELIEELKKIKNETIEHPKYDLEDTHINLDNLLLEYIGDEQVEQLFHSIKKWYA
jgi:argininosuccinate lyase